MTLATLTPPVVPLVLGSADEHHAFLRELRTQQGVARGLAQGAVLLRGTGVTTEEDFEQLARTATPNLLDYDYASTPRSRVRGKVYTSTEYPPEQSIPLHNEMAYAATWPELLWFCCLQPAASGGATPIADSREVYRRIPSSVRESFERKGVLYRRAFNTGLDLTWQQSFGTEDPTLVEQYCERAGMAYRWCADGILRTEQSRPAVLSHPQTGEKSWFNQAHLFHPSGLAPEVRELLLDVVGPENLPRTALYGDGAEIEDSALDAVRAAYAACTIEFEWVAGDVLIVDNVSFAHGRKPFSGARRVLVAMA